MAALDFPNSPTVGATYTGPNGAVYTWDGAAWTVSGVVSTGSAAGGDLSGTYPNPVVAPGKITIAKIALGQTKYAWQSWTDSTLVTAGNNVWAWIGELSMSGAQALATDRDVFLMLRVYLEIYRLAAGSLGQTFSVSTYVGGTSQTLDGTNTSNEQAASIALTNVNDTVSVWYQYFTWFRPTTTTFLWKAFLLNPNNATFGCRKHVTGINIYQPT